MKRPDEIEIAYCPEHFSVMCNAMIPAAWESTPYRRGVACGPKQLAHTKEEAIAIAQEVWPGVRITK